MQRQVAEVGSHAAVQEGAAEANGDSDNAEAILEAMGVVRLQPDAALALLTRRLF